ncbi:major facilitator superfamily domain-containing protein [Aspergillus pseudodeflectus]|uniref:Major facilitator superfamily domain-containing protein n=1 Tax=Aspergillus pseudodeflectus TaxID=176178 RepID=A0ABR4L4H2_9EURO
MAEPKKPSEAMAVSKSAQTEPEQPPAGNNTTDTPTPIEQLDLETTAAEDSPSPTRSKRRIAAIMTALYLVLFITALDQTIIATSIPTISAALHSASGYTWIGSAYLLATAAAGPIWARISDIFGRKPALLASVTGFAAASILAALSTSMRMLIAARALQGASGGGLIQMVYITISDLFSVRRRALWFGLLGLMWAVAGSTGPLVGGGLTERVSWRWCFWINLPVCGVALVLLLTCFDVHNPRTKLKDGVVAIDWLGTLAIVGLTLLLLLGMEFGGTVFPWSSPKVICLIVFGVVMIGVFIVTEKKLARYPLIPMSLFQSGPTNAAFILAFAHGMVSFGTEYYLPLYFQSVKQASPLRSGLLILPMMVTEAATDILTGILIHRTGRYREITWVGTILMALGTGLYIKMDRETSLGTIIAFQIVGGIGTAMLFQTPVLAIQNSVSRAADTASATATLGLARNIATSFSIVLGGVVFSDGMDRRRSMLATAGLDHGILDRLSGDSAAANVDVVKVLSDEVQKIAVRDAFAWSVRNMFIFYTSIAGVAVLAGVFIKQKEMRREHVETKTGVGELAKREEA